MEGLLPAAEFGLSEPLGRLGGKVQPANERAGIAAGRLRGGAAVRGERGPIGGRVWSGNLH